MSDRWRTQTMQDERPAAELGPCTHWMAFAAAVQFLSRIPLSRNPPSGTAVARCLVYFPLVGSLIGVLTAIVLGAACHFWPAWLAVIVALAVEAQLTGALHEDALADFCDAFGGGWTRADVLRILKDSRVGTYGVLGLGFSLAIRAGATIEVLNGCGQANWWTWSAALVASSAVGRWAMVLIMVLLPPMPGRESLSRDVGGHVSRWQLVVATLWMLPFAACLAVLLPLQSLLAAVLLALPLLWLLRLVHRRLGGVTGDCLGCIAYVSQLVVLLAAAGRWH